MQISCNDSARFPLYNVDDAVRTMNETIRTRSAVRSASLAALAAPRVAPPWRDACRQGLPAQDAGNRIWSHSGFSSVFTAETKDTHLF
jgi:hypothetical protein